MTDRDFARAVELGVFGVARIGPDLTVISRAGSLMDWLPPPGAPLAESPVFFGFEPEFAALRAGKRQKLDMPGLRLPPVIETPFALTLSCDPVSGDFLIHAAADGGALEFERLLAHERRETQILADQARAAGRILREQAALYRDIVESAGEPVLRLGADFRVSFANSVLCDLLGVGEGEILGRAVDDVLTSPLEESWKDRLKRAEGQSFEQALTRATGENVWIWWRVHWVSSDQQTGEYQAIGRDITDLRRLRAESLARAEEARVNAVMRERLRIAHDLHDTLVHSLVALAPQIHLIRKIAGPEAPERLAEELALAEQAVRDGVARARAAVGELRSQPIEPEGLGAALEQLARRFSERTGIHVLVDFDKRAQALGPETRETFYRIAEEALRNAELHAQPSRVGVYLASEDQGAVILVVADDGRGFDPNEIPEGHYGLIGMRERAEMIGARLTVDSEPGAGARIVVTLPR